AWKGFNTLRTEGFKNITLWEHTRTSLWRVVRGMIFGIVLGVPIGIAMGLGSRLRGFFDTPVELFRPIPPLALLPLFIIWFGIGDAASVRLLMFASVWIMIIAARAGVRTVNLSKVRAAYSLGASKPQVLRRVIMPNALPELFTGIRIALGVSWGTLVAAELVGTDTGLGSMIFQARNFFRLDVMVVGVIVISTIGVLMDMAMRFLEARLVPWRGKS
ncbi:MAG: ABC transporter permease subunit, partial [Actinomycetia bacterium]|nr:ABC transporter permease subunit [Actinomycetes bacterium]